MLAIEKCEVRHTRVRTKVNVGVELALRDGSHLSGSVFIGLDERVQDLLNDDKPFFPLRQSDEEILLVNKAAVAVCRPLDCTG